MFDHPQRICRCRNTKTSNRTPCGVYSSGNILPSRWNEKKNDTTTKRAQSVLVWIINGIRDFKYENITYPAVFGRRPTVVPDFLSLPSRGARPFSTRLQNQTTNDLTNVIHARVARTRCTKRECTHNRYALRTFGRARTLTARGETSR